MSRFQVVLIPFPTKFVGDDLPAAYALASVSVLSVPPKLVTMYDQSVTAQLTAELQNAEVGIAMLDTKGNPIVLYDEQGNQQTNPVMGLCRGDNSISRVTGPLIDLTVFFRYQQVQCLGLMAHTLNTALTNLARNFTVTLYLGSVTIGRPTTMNPLSPEYVPPQLIAPPPDTIP